MIVVDASCFVDALVGSPERARDALRILASAQEVGAPDFVDAEVANGLRGRWLGGRISETQFATALDVFAGIPIARHPSAVLVHRAWSLRDNASAYDACYVGLAESLRVPLYTADIRLSRVPGVQCEVRVIGPDS